MFDGFKANDPVITVFSCSNYAGSGNKAGLIHINKSAEIVPKVINANGLEGWLRLEQLSKYTSGSSSEASHSRSSQPPKPPNKVDISSILQKMKQTPHTAAEK